MLALISQRQIKSQYNTDCDQLEKEYIIFFEKFGLELRPVSNFQNVDLGNAGLLILTGGGSIHKEQPQRDNVEKKIFEQAREKSVPIIGICRGMQYINLLMGGNIHENAELKHPRPNRTDHVITLLDEEIKVNNFHNDVVFVSDLADKLEVIGLDMENNTVEAFYSKGVLAVQWHPERAFEDEKSEKYSFNLIKKFIENRGQI